MIDAACVRLPRPPPLPRQLTPEQEAGLETPGALAGFSKAWKLADLKRALELHDAPTLPAVTR
jgi:hypothetical protein